MVQQGFVSKNVYVRAMCREISNFGHKQAQNEPKTGLHEPKMGNAIYDTGVVTPYLRHRRRN